MTEIQLTDAQRQAVQAQPGRPVDVVDPATQQRYVLLARDQYEHVRALLEQGGEPGRSEHAPEIPAGIVRSQQAFWRDLPGLLSQRKLRGQWTCYHGDERVGTAPTRAELVREAQRRGIPRDAYYVGRIRPQDQAPWEPVEVEPGRAQSPEPLPPEP